MKRVELSLQTFALLSLAGAWLTGIVLASWLPLSPFFLLSGSCITLLLLIPLWRQRTACVALLLVFSLLLGAWRYAVTLPVNDAQSIANSIGTGSIQLRGSVTDEPTLTEKSGLLHVSVNSISKNGGMSWQKADGQIEVQAQASQIGPPYGPDYGDSVELRGKLQAATAYSHPGVFASMVFPRISVTSPGGLPLLGALYHFRMRLATTIERALPQQEASLLIALLLSLHM